MNDLCIRCLLDDANGAYCPNCGRALMVRKHVPSVAELQTFESQVIALLPRLRQMHAALEVCRQRAVERRCVAAIQYIEKRQMFLLRVEQRLQDHLRFAQRELAARNCIASGRLPTA
jgi:uncharacterized protein YkuJ